MILPTPATASNGNTSYIHLVGSSNGCLVPGTPFINHSLNDCASLTISVAVRLFLPIRTRFRFASDQVSNEMREGTTDVSRVLRRGWTEDMLYDSVACGAYTGRSEVRSESNAAKNLLRYQQPSAKNPRNKRLTLPRTSSQTSRAPASPRDSPLHQTATQTAAPLSAASRSPGWP